MIPGEFIHSFGDVLIILFQDHIGFRGYLDILNKLPSRQVLAVIADRGKGVHESRVRWAIAIVVVMARAGVFDHHESG